MSPGDTGRSLSPGRDQAASPPPPRPRFLSEADCHDIAQRLARFAQGGGETIVRLVSRWTAHVRWARNQILTTGEDRDSRVHVGREIRGARSNEIMINAITDEALVAAARQAERLTGLDRARVDDDVGVRPGSPFRYQDEPTGMPNLFIESTYQLEAPQRAEAARQLLQSAAAAGMLSAGYLQVSATSYAFLTSSGYARFFRYTEAQYSTTVRDPKGVGSGWAGVDWADWSKVDGAALSARALDKCLQSRNPVAVEPGRYTTILEPQAVCDFLASWGFKPTRQASEGGRGDWFHLSGGGDHSDEPPYTQKNFLNNIPVAKLGQKVIDERLTLSADPMDPELGFPPYSMNQWTYFQGDVYHPVTWIERGVLRALPTWRDYAIERQGQNLGVPSSGALRMSVSGPTSTVEEMIASTKRGLVVTRFDAVEGPFSNALVCWGYTRDGLWLIENGKISKPVKNLRFTESISFALNNVEQVGVPQRTFHPGPGWISQWYQTPAPMFLPALKIKDFSFPALIDAI